MRHCLLEFTPVRTVFRTRCYTRCYTQPTKEKSDPWKHVGTQGPLAVAAGAAAFTALLQYPLTESRLPNSADRHVEVPWVGYAFEGVYTIVLEVQARSRDEVLYRLRDEHL